MIWARAAKWEALEHRHIKSKNVEKRRKPEVDNYKKQEVKKRGTAKIIK